MNLKIIIPILFLYGCTATAVYKTGYDFSKIKKIGIMIFYSDNVVGSAVKDEFIRQLLAKQFDVMQINNENEFNKVDAVIRGTVVQYTPERKYLVSVSHVGVSTQPAIVFPYVLESGGRGVYEWNPALLSQDFRMIFTDAKIDISAQLVDSKTNEVVWTNSVSYEGLDTQSSIWGGVGYLVNSMPFKK